MLMQILIWKLEFLKVNEKALKGFISFTSLVRASSTCYLDLLEEILNLELLNSAISNKRVHISCQ